MWFLPSYGRPNAIDKLMAAPGGLPPHEKIVAIYTADDPCLPEYLARWPFNHEIAPAGSRLGDIMRLIVERFPMEECYGILNDDHEPITPFWWKDMAEAAGDRYIAICMSPPRGLSCIGGIQMIGGGLVRAMGCLSPACLNHNYTDNFIDTIGRDFDLVRPLPEVLVLHHHPELDPSVPTDATYARGSADRQADADAFRAWLTSDDRREMANRIAALLGINVVAMDLSKHHLAICTPFHDYRIDWIYEQSLTETIRLAAGYKMRVSKVSVGGGSHIGKARERLLWQAMKTPATHIMFVDSDMGWDGRVPLHLIASDHDVAAAVGVKKQEELALCCNFFDGEQEFDPRTQFLKVPEVGFGMIVIKREVIERMCKAYPDLAYESDDGEIEYALFLDMIDKPRKGRRVRLSEDLSFCRRWTRIGGDIHVDHQIALRHAGRKEYTGKPSDMFNFNMKRAAE